VRYARFPRGGIQGNIAQAPSISGDRVVEEGALFAGTAVAQGTAIGSKSYSKRRAAELFVNLPLMVVLGGESGR
jgi:hypothetical protein